MDMSKRHYYFTDRLCLGLDQAIRALTDNAKTTGQPYPAKGVDNPPLTETARQQSAAFMRINHAGEICAQALYHGQGLVTRQAAMQEKMQQAAIEEGDHLEWCRKRLDELGSHVSYLNPFWYTGSFCIGLVAGWVGDKWSLGFVAETEQQVVKHLEKHLQTLPAEDQRSYRILQQMQEDEAKHRNEAIASGAHELPGFIKRIMTLASRVMVKTAYYV